MIQGLNVISTARYDQGLNVISTARYDQGLNKIPKLKNKTTFFCVQNRITVFKKKNFDENIKSKHTENTKILVDTHRLGSEY